MQRGWSMSVMQQATLCIVLGTIASSVCLLLPLMRQAHAAHAVGLSSTFYIVATMGAFLGSIWISYDLRTGIESERWPEEQIERFRATFSTPVVHGVYAAVTIAALLFGFFTLLSRHDTHGASYGLFMLPQTLSQIVIAARRPKSCTPVPRIGWNSGPRITSDHWGRHE